MTNASVNRRGSLRWRTFSKIKILLPPIEEQIYIEKFKKHLDNEIGYLQKELQYFQLQKKELTQKLLTGEVRHPDFIKKRITKEEENE
jgi:type I restriction enzyme S subunit